MRANRAGEKLALGLEHVARDAEAFGGVAAAAVVVVVV